MFLNSTSEVHLAELRDLIRALGSDGGQISPSIYDTAQVLRLVPSAVGVQGLEWLLAQQQPDGGWGNPIAPRARDLPTLAALLILHEYDRHPQARASVAAGVGFLQQHTWQHWSDSLPDDIPVGIELLLPPLLAQAVGGGLSIPQQPYTSLITLGKQRRQQIARIRLLPGSTPVHSWEGWGSTADASVIDGSGGVGHSPAATAAWLRLSAGHSDRAKLAIGAQYYFKQASAATGQHVPLLPTVWPIDRFEQIWILYALLVTRLLDHPQLRDLVRPQLDDLYQALHYTGIGMSDYFTQDGDITATAVAILKASGYPVTGNVLMRFQCGDHFCTYPQEMQPSLTTTAHAVLALALCGKDVTRSVRYLIDKRLPDGRWIGDKWHYSWLYTSAQIVTALAYAGQVDALVPAIEALLHAQQDDGGWGIAQATAAETSYAVLALCSIQRYPELAARVRAALEQAGVWLAGVVERVVLSDGWYWIGKELYSPYRVDRGFVLSAVIMLQEMVPDDVLERMV